MRSRAAVIEEIMTTVSSPHHTPVLAHEDELGPLARATRCPENGDHAGGVKESFVTILFTDLVGSSSRLGRRGVEAADALRREHFAQLRVAVAAHGGNEIKTTGDGLMVSFTSAVVAVRCAIDMQHNSDLAVRIGIDAGEPVREGDDFYGTTVTVASQLCATAEPGEILASDIVAQIAAPRVDVPTHAAGNLKLRGLEERVSAVRVLWSREASPQPADEGEQRVITTVIVDDERLLRTGFRVILEAEADITVVGEAADGRAALDVVRRQRPDVVLMDIRMPELDGLQAAEQLLTDPDLPSAVIMLTTFDRDQYIYAALRIGASGFLLRTPRPTGCSMPCASPPLVTRCSRRRSRVA
jgi:class 3 adenylate cyclase/CheY-like chemotaxis protein